MILSKVAFFQNCCANTFNLCCWSEYQIWSLNHSYTFSFVILICLFCFSELKCDRLLSESDASQVLRNFYCIMQNITATHADLSFFLCRHLHGSQKSCLRWPTAVCYWARVSLSGIIHKWMEKNFWRWLFFNQYLLQKIKQLGYVYRTRPSAKGAEWWRLNCIEFALAVYLQL